MPLLMKRMMGSIKEVTGDTPKEMQKSIQPDAPIADKPAQK